jgi:hypothetical protein
MSLFEGFFIFLALVVFNVLVFSFISWTEE